MTKFHEWPNHRINLLVGGTPCQAFSVAGLREGLSDPRGNLTLTFLGVADKYRPEWVVWENVPGVLSDRTNAFGQFLAGLGQLGYGFAYRMLDAQYFGVPQRRRRMFVVGCLGGWERAAAVLFESESLRGDSAPGREKREGTAGGVADCLTKCRAGSPDEVRGTGNLIAGAIPIQEIGKRQSGTSMNGVGHGKEGDPMFTLQSSAVHGVAMVAPTLNASGAGTARGTIQANEADFFITKQWPASIAPTLNASFGDKQGLEDQHALNGGELFVPAQNQSVSQCRRNGPLRCRNGNADSDAARRFL